MVAVKNSNIRTLVKKINNNVTITTLQHTGNSGIVKTIYSGIFSHIKRYSAIFTHVQAS